MRRIILVVGVTAVVAIASCVLLLPDGMVVRGPILNSLLGRGVDSPSEAVVQGRFRVAPGFRVELFAEGIENARFLRFSPGGSLLISQPREGKILHVLGDQDADGRSDGQRVLVDGDGLTKQPQK